jgi:hypothetical protein
MCTTARHAVRAGPLAAAGDGGGRLVAVSAGSRLAAEVADGGGWVPTAGLGDGRTTPVRPQLASATTRTAATAATRVCRPPVPSRHPVDLAWAHHRLMAPRRTGSSMNRQDSAAATTAAVTCRVPRARLSWPWAGVVSTMMG